VESHLQSILRLYLDLACVQTRKLEERVNALENELIQQRSKEYTWKISGFSEVLRQAKSGEKVTLESAPFYKYGYKCRLCLDPNGVNSGKTLISQYFLL